MRLFALYVATEVSFVRRFILREAQIAVDAVYFERSYSVVRCNFSINMFKECGSLQFSAFISVFMSVEPLFVVIFSEVSKKLKHNFNDEIRVTNYE